MITLLVTRHRYSFTTAKRIAIHLGAIVSSGAMYSRVKSINPSHAIPRLHITRSSPVQRLRTQYLSSLNNPQSPAPSNALEEVHDRLDGVRPEHDDGDDGEVPIGRKVASQHLIHHPVSFAITALLRLLRGYLGSVKTHIKAVPPALFQCAPQAPGACAWAVRAVAYCWTRRGRTAAERWTRARATAERMGDVRGKGAMLWSEE